MSGLDEALSGAVIGVTKQWAKQRKAEERHAAAAWRRHEALTGRSRDTLREAAFDVMEMAYMEASAGGPLPTKARQVMYKARALRRSGHRVGPIMATRSARIMGVDIAREDAKLVPTTHPVQA